MNRQKFLAELSKLLGFMSSWDRDAEMNKYIAMLDEAGDEAELIESLGTPTQIAISIALGYKPSPRPGTQPPEPEPMEKTQAKPETVEKPEAGTETAEKPEAGTEPESKPESEPEPLPPPPPKKKRGEDEIVTDVEFDYGMELALLMGEPVASAVESAFKGEYLPDPDLSLDEILREIRGNEGTDGVRSASGEASAEAGAEVQPAGPEAAPEEPETSETAAETEDTPEESAETGDEPEAPEAAPEAEEEAPPEAEADAAGAEAEAEDAPEAESAASVEESAEAGPEAAGTEPETSGDEPGAKASEDEDAPAPENEQEPAEADADAPGEPEEDTAGAEEAEEAETPAGDGPVFDAATAPLPEAVKSAESGDAEPEQPAAAPEPEAKHPPHLVFDPANFAPLPEDKPVEDEESEETGGEKPPRTARRPVGIAVYVLFSLVIGIPAALLLILIGVPVLLSGLGIIAGTVYAATHIIAALSMFSDILLVAGAGLAIGGVGLLIAWLGLWLSIELGSLWINAVMLKLGRALCFKREADV